MARLEELINSLGTVLICYNEKQKINVLTSPDPDRLKARERAISLLQADDFEKKFHDLNLEATSSKYKDRVSFLGFIKDEIVVLKKLLDRKSPFSNEELDEFKKKITQLFMDFKKLLSIKKTATHTVQVNLLDNQPMTSLALYGLTESGWTGASLCYSGSLIKEEVLQRFNIKDNASEEDIKEIAEHLCQVHQNALLVSKLKAQQIDIMEVKREHQIAIQREVDAHEETKRELEIAKIKYSQQQTLMEEQQKLLETKQREIQELVLKNSELKAVLDKNQKRDIETLDEEETQTPTRELFNPALPRGTFAYPFIASRFFSLAYPTPLPKLGEKKNDSTLPTNTQL
jgi:hypothetical protein